MLYTARQAAYIVGITYRQLDSWDSSGVVSPTASQAAGSGSERAYAEEDLLPLALAVEARRHGLPLARIARLVEDRARIRAAGYVLIRDQACTFVDSRDAGLDDAFAKLLPGATCSALVVSLLRLQKHLELCKADARLSGALETRRRGRPPSTASRQNSTKRRGDGSRRGAKREVR